MPPKFIFIRHGEARHNVAYHASDQKVFEDEANRDAPLTELGRKQAQETANKLVSLNIKSIWSSPLTRCIETAEEIFEETSSQSIYLHDCLLERQGGNHVCNERKSKKEIQALFEIVQTQFLSEKSASWIKREDWTSLHYRMKSFLLLLTEVYKKLDETSYIVIVSHKDAIQSLIEEDLKNAEFVILTSDEILKRNKIE